MTIRYMLDRDCRVGVIKDGIPNWSNFSRGGEGYIDLPQNPLNGGPRFVNILESVEHFVRIKIFYSNGEVLECWVCMAPTFPFSIFNDRELYDGRFNV